MHTHTLAEVVSVSVGQSHTLMISVSVGLSKCGTVGLFLSLCHCAPHPHSHIVKGCLLEFETVGLVNSGMCTKLHATTTHTA